MRSVRFFFHHPFEIFARTASLVRNIIPDKQYIKILFRSRMGYKLDLKDPKTFSEKLQWLKLYDRRPEYVRMVDKLAAKEYVGSIIGQEFIIPTLGVWNRAEDIEWDSLPEQFVLKCTHDSGGIVICHDKSKLDILEAVDVLNTSLNRDYYLVGREWPYKNVPRRIIAEKLIEPEHSGKDLFDYKFFCFDGVVRMIEVDYNRFIHHNRNLYSPEWERINAELGYPSQPGIEFQRPPELDIAIQAARKLSMGIPHIRVDFYFVGGHVYFGELTLYHGSGMEYTKPESFNRLMGDWIALPNRNK